VRFWNRMLIFSFFLAAWSCPASAAQDLNSPAVLLNNMHLETSANIEDGLVYLPVRNICESLGYIVGWSKDDQSISIISQNESIILHLQPAQTAIGDHVSYMQKMPVIIQERIFMPADFFADNLALTMDYDPAQNVVLLKSVSKNPIQVKTIKTSVQEPGLKITQQYPQIEMNGNQQVQEEVNRLFEEAAEKSAAEGRKNAAELAQYRQEHPDTSPNPCEVYFDYQLKYNRAGLLSVVLQDYQYAGGAHGSTRQTSYSIRLDSGQHYSLRDWFREDADYVSVLSAKVKEQLAVRNLEQALFEPFERIDPDQDYYISNLGLTVYFQQYDILPYAAGIQEFTADFADLKSLLNDPEIFR